MSGVYDLDDLNRRMQGAIQSLKGELSGLRTGRASSSMLEPITVEAYGGTMPLSQLATVSVPEPRLITVQVWDRSMAGAVERAIRESSLGLNPVVEGTSMRIPIPELNAERRQELVKVAHKYAESARIAVRHVRRDGMETLKKLEKDGKVSQDDHRTLSDKVQKLTDGAIADIDHIVAQKEHEISQV
ncbi:ribosome recycling factor [Pseudoxanthobacter sp. M-2]|uniref:ribosome recycling factor n=1 Tax=Pseudoxanthobacter sp. M-2 TaxID=3078754 RepID=UPI0038FD18E6